MLLRYIFAIWILRLQAFWTPYGKSWCFLYWIVKACFPVEITYCRWLLCLCMCACHRSGPAEPSHKGPPELWLQTGNRSAFSQFHITPSATAALSQAPFYQTLKSNWKLYPSVHTCNTTNKLITYIPHTLPSGCSLVSLACVTMAGRRVPVYSRCSCALN